MQAPPASCFFGFARSGAFFAGSRLLFRVEVLNSPLSLFLSLIGERPTLAQGQIRVIRVNDPLVALRAIFEIGELDEATLKNEFST